MNPASQQLMRVRKREGIAVRSMATRLGITRAAYEKREEPTHDLTVSELLECCAAMDVPVTHFFDSIPSVPDRANILRAYKSALRLKELVGGGASVIVERLCEDLLKVVPEMDGHTRIANKAVTPWPAVGHRRGDHELSRREECPIDTRVFSSAPIPEFQN